MFGPLGFPELVFLLVLALLIFGPRKLPQVGRTLGKGLAEFRKASTELKRSINAEMDGVRDLDPRRILKEDSPSRPEPASRGARSEAAPAAGSGAAADAGPGPSAEAASEPVTEADGRVARGTAYDSAQSSPETP